MLVVLDVLAKQGLYELSAAIIRARFHAIIMRLEALGVECLADEVFSARELNLAPTDKTRLSHSYVDKGFTAYGIEAEKERHVMEEGMCFARVNARRIHLFHCKAGET